MNLLLLAEILLKEEQISLEYEIYVVLQQKVAVGGLRYTWELKRDGGLVVQLAAAPPEKIIEDIVEKLVSFGVLHSEIRYFRLRVFAHRELLRAWYK